jgi:hypothetical protein
MKTPQNPEAGDLLLLEQSDRAEVIYTRPIDLLDRGYLDYEDLERAMISIANAVEKAGSVSIGHANSLRAQAYGKYIQAERTFE